jgi:glycosyltransferase involved in cell wall biosynthesis
MTLISAEVPHMPKIDIVVPCYNYGRFLEQCVRSVLDQSFSDLRVLIIDDASSDDSLSVARRLEKSDQRVAVISHSQNWGHIRTYNQGIAWAEADYFLLLSADDLIAPGALERAAEIMDANLDIVLTHGICVAWHDVLPFPEIYVEQVYAWRRQDLIREMCTRGANIVSTPTAIVRTSTQQAIGGYRSSLPHSGDMEMWLRFAALGATATIDAVQAVYRKHSTAMSNPYFAEKLRDYMQRKCAFDSFFQKYDDRVPEYRNLRAQAYRTLATKAYWSGIAQWCRGHRDNGYKLLRFSFELSPKLRYCPPLVALVTTPNLYKKVTCRQARTRVSTSNLGPSSSSSQ